MQSLPEQMNRQAKVFLALAVFSALTWLLDAYFSGEEFFQEIIPAESPDYFGNGYTKIEMDEQGIPSYELYAEKIEHFKQHDTTEMEKPVLTYYKEKTPPWLIRSETGQLSGGDDVLYLNGKVFISREQAPGVRRVKVNTSNARVRPKENYAETDEWVELVTPPDNMSGTGARLYFKDPIYLELLSNVRGKYVSP